MLGVLLYHAGAPVRIDWLVEQLWEDGRALEDCRASLYALASRIRAVLHSVGIGPALVRLTSMQAYRLDIDPSLVDFHRFRQLVTEAREAAGQQQPDSAVALLVRALALWQDEPLADLRGAHAEHLRREMTEAWLEANKLLADCRLKVGQHHSALVLLEPLLRSYPFDETLAQYWISALCATGRQADARTYLVSFRQRFRKEMRSDPALHLPEAAPLSRARPRRAVAVPRRLPKDISDFTGHDELFRQLDALTDADRGETNIVVLTGMPGVGKTTLAVHWAHQRRHRFPDGQLYLNANAYGSGAPVEPVEALGRFLSALDVPAERIPVSVDERRDRLNQLLAGRRMLIVLDNVRDSGHARSLIPTSGTCVTLITSRTRLTALTIRDGARSLTISPFPDNDCLALLRRVIGTARAAAEPAALQALARLSGGLPLALRIIGERVAVRPRASIADLVEELSAHLLDSECEDEEEASLRSAFAWSYDALGPEPARLFRLLGLYPGSSISPEAGGAMLGAGVDDAERLLNTLARVHFINHDTVRRYRFHDLLRLFAAERASREERVDEQRQAMRRLLDWYVLTTVNAAWVLAPDRPLVPDLPAPEDVRPLAFNADAEAMKWCEAERGNIGAVTRWATAHGFHRHAWQIPGAIHEIFDRYGRQQDVLHLHELALVSVRRDGHPVGEIGTLNNLAATYFMIHDYRRAAESFEACIQLARELGDTNAEIPCAHNLASVHLRMGNTGEAVRLSNQVLDACRKGSNASGEASALHRLGDAYRLMKRYDEAVTYYLDALAIRQRIGALRGQGVTHGEIAALYLETGQPELALEHCREALAMHDRTRDEAARCDALTTMADIERALARYEDAVRDAKDAITLSDEMADDQRRCHALVVLADALAISGNVDAAGRACIEALNSLDDAEPESRALRARLLVIARSVGVVDDPGAPDGRPAIA